jgi:hypothetical protein
MKVISLCSPSAAVSSIKSCEKIDGGFSRAFIIIMGNGKRVVAKFPTAAAGPGRFVTNSEVATMEYSKPKPLSSQEQSLLIYTYSS